MRVRTMMHLVAALCLMLAVFALTSAQDKGTVPDKIKDEAKESAEAAKTFREIMQAPDKGIPQAILDDAKCVAVFPSTIKGGFIIGGQKGDGVVSCRTAQGWSAPAYLDMAGGTVGAQIGAQATDYVLMFMTDNGINSLLSGKFSLGGEVSAAAGPVGRTAGAGTDWKLNSQILTYSRSKGLFAGATLSGVVISTDNSDMEKVYGSGVTTKGVLQENKFTAPAGVRDLPNTLASYSSRKGK
jgi:lipid-binding SYLF domain-containing protein